MRDKAFAIVFVLFAFVTGAAAQGVVTPPVSTFKPDTSMPSMNVPEFVITGKTRVELPKAVKPTVEIDSSYFQDKTLRGAGPDIPVSREIGSQNIAQRNRSTSLYARASFGHYYTTNYLVSGTGGIDGFGINGSISGDYTSGFIANTARRDFSIQAGVSRDIDSPDLVRSSNSMTLGYTRSSYSLYGDTLNVLQRSTGRIKFDVNSDMYLGELPLAFGLDFDRYSLSDYWHNTESALTFLASTQVQLPSGWLGFNGSLRFGNHTISSSPTLRFIPLPRQTGLDRSLYDLRLGGSYGNSSLLGVFSYSVGAKYYQYRDDSSSTVAKIYPALRASYRINPMISLFASFNGSVHEANLSNFISTDMYVDGYLPLVNTQTNVDFIFGGRVAVTDDFVLTPRLRIQNAKYYPMFVTGPMNVSTLLYAGKAEIMSISLTGRYTAGDLSAQVMLRYRKTSADSLSSIPNVPDFDGNVGATYRITADLKANADLQFLSRRYSNMALSTKLNPVGLLNFRVTYGFNISTLPFEAFAGGNNILNEKYFIWQGYREFPLTLYIGLSANIL